MAITDPHVQFTSYLDHDRATRALSSTWFPLWSDRLDPFDRTVRGRGTTRGSTILRSRVSPVQEQWGCRRGMVTIYQVFQLYYLFMKFTGIGVAFSALEKLHLVTTFIFGGRGLLNLSKNTIRQVLYTIPYSPIVISTKTTTRKVANNDNAQHTTPPSLFSFSWY